MAKRQRTRPGQRPPASRPARPQARAEAPRPAGALSAAEEARAAELEARIVAEERAAEEARSRSRDRRRQESSLGSGYPAARSREGSLVAARSEQEYAYVVRDVRRIVRVGGSLLIVMFVLFLVIDVAGLVKL